MTNRIAAISFNTFREVEAFSRREADPARSDVEAGSPLPKSRHRAERGGGTSRS